MASPLTTGEEPQQALTQAQRERLQAIIEQQAPGFLDDLIRDVAHFLNDGRPGRFKLGGNITGRRMLKWDIRFKATRHAGKGLTRRE